MSLFGKNNNNQNNYTDLSGMNMYRNTGSQFNSDYDDRWDDDSRYDSNNNYGYSANAVNTYQDYRKTLSLSDFSRKVYFQMFIGLAITFGIGIFAVLNPEATRSIISSHAEVFFILCGVEVLLVFILGFLVEKMSPAVSIAIFYVYSVINGLTIAPVLTLFELESVFLTIAVTGGIFGILSLVGKFSKIDVSKWGTILMIGLFGLIFYSVISLLFRIPMSDLFIGIIGVILFMGFTIYDTKKIKSYYAFSSSDPQRQGKYAIVAALALYLDFINLFLYLLRFFARHRD